MTLMKVAFTMQLEAGNAEEYKRRHDEIWPELSQLLRDAGISDYSIFLEEETGQLFAIHSLSPDNQIDSLPHHPIMKKWWAYMADLMLTNPDNSPMTMPLLRVFHME